MLNSYDFSTIRILRKQKKMTIQQLADLSGLTFPTIASIETNKSQPSLASLDQIAQSLDLTMIQLLLFCQRLNPLRKTAENVSETDGFKTKKLKNCRMVSHGDVQVYLMKGLMDMVTDSKREHGDVFELCYVLSGEIGFATKGENYLLRKNDTVFFDASNEHLYTFLTDGELLVVHIPRYHLHIT